jgi:ATP-dependent protease ClpP protease subunit
MTWFHIEHKKGVAHAHIFGELGIGQSAQDFIAELGYCQTVELRLDCLGGDSTAGIEVHDALCKRNTSATITGRCGSSGLITIMGAKNIACNSTARLHVHQPSSFVYGHVSDLRFAADGLEQIRTRFEQIISARTKQPPGRVREWVAGETFFDAAEARAVGLVDEIITAPAVPPVVIAASDNTRPDADTEDELIFTAWLSGYGKLKVGNREKFTRNLADWVNQNVKE